MLHTTSHSLIQVNLAPYSNARIGTTSQNNQVSIFYQHAQYRLPMQKRAIAAMCKGKL